MPGRQQGRRGLQPDLAHSRGNWSYPTAVRFGAGRIAELGRAARELGMARPLLVTDAGLAGLPLFRQITDSCAQAGLACALFAGVRENPTGANVQAGAAAFHEAAADGVIAVGGGSGLDCGKSIALLAGLGGDLWRFAWPEDGAATHERTGVPIIAVPTTAGTGAEVEASAIVTDESTRLKRALANPSLLPALVIADPALTLGLPPRLTAATGMDALSHALEAYCVDGFHPMADGIAVEAIRLVHDWLPRAVGTPGDIAARSHMMAAALLGATAFAKGLGAMHALSHPIGGLHGLHHGLTNAVLMPYVLRHNRPAVEDRMARLARWLDLPAGFDGVLDWITALRRQVGIPDGLSALGLDGSDADEIGRRAAADVCAPTNPVPVDAAALAGIYRDAVNAHGTGVPLAS